MEETNCGKGKNWDKKKKKDDKMALGDHVNEFHIMEKSFQLTILNLKQAGFKIIIPN